MYDLLLFYQFIIALEYFYDLGIGLENKFTLHGRIFIRSGEFKLAVVVNRRIDIKSVFKPDLIVVLSVAGSYMDNTGAFFKGHKFAGHCL